MNRGTFYLVFIYAVWALMGVILGIPAAIYLLWPPRPKKEQDWIEVGRVAQLKVRPPTNLCFERIESTAGR